MKTKRPPVPVPRASHEDQLRLYHDLTEALNEPASILRASRNRYTRKGKAINADRTYHRTPYVQFDAEMGGRYLSVYAKEMLTYFLARGPKFRAYNVAKLMKNALGISKNTSGKYLQELRRAGHAFHCRFVVPGYPGIFQWGWKFSERPAGLSESILKNKTWAIDTPQYGPGATGIESDIPIKGRPGETRKGHKSAAFEGMRPGADFNPNTQWGATWWAKPGGDDAEIMAAAQTPRPTAKTRKTKAAQVENLTQEPGDLGVKIVRKKRAKTTQKGVKKAGVKPQDARKKTLTVKGTPAAQVKNLRKNTEVPKTGTVNKERSSRTIGKILTYLPLTRAQKRALSSQAIIRRKPLPPLRESVFDALPDDCNNNQPDLGPEGDEAYGLKGRGYRGHKGDYPPILHWPATDYPGSPPMVLNTSRLPMSNYLREAPAPVDLRPSKPAQEWKKYSPEPDHLCIVPGYSHKVPFQSLELVRCFLPPNPTRDDLYRALDILNPALRTEEVVQELCVEHLSESALVSHIGTTDGVSDLDVDDETIARCVDEYNRRQAEAYAVEPTEGMQKLTRCLFGYATY